MNRTNRTIFTILTFCALIPIQIQMEAKRDKQKKKRKDGQ